jgi:hypothetical protein
VGTAVISTAEVGCEIGLNLSTAVLMLFVSHLSFHGWQKQKSTLVYQSVLQMNFGYAPRSHDWALSELTNYGSEVDGL